MAKHSAAVCYARYRFPHPPCSSADASSSGSCGWENPLTELRRRKTNRITSGITASIESATTSSQVNSDGIPLSAISRSGSNWLPTNKLTIVAGRIAMSVTQKNVRTFIFVSPLNTLIVKNGTYGASRIETRNQVPSRCHNSSNCLNLSPNQRRSMSLNR